MILKSFSVIYNHLYMKIVPTNNMCLFKRLICMFVLICCTIKVCIGSDTISLGQSIYANETLISKGRNFELGFFSPGNSSNHFIGIWYKTISARTVVWVANRASPIRQLSNNSQLVLAENGILSLLSDSNTIIWAVTYGGSSVASKGVLLDNGNFVLSDGLSVIWQSFDYPTDTWLPGANIGRDVTSTNARQILTSWKNPNDPSPGIFSFGLNQNGSPELFIWRNQSEIVWRSGAWNGQTFASIPELGNLTKLSYSNEQGSYITYNYLNGSTSIISRYVMSYIGRLDQMVWTNRSQEWEIFFSMPQSQCDIFAVCGAFGVCNMNTSPFCQCIKGFEPRNKEDWSLSDFSGGCVRSKPLMCNEGFVRISNVRLPAYSRSLDFDGADICEFRCTKNCSCTAFAYNGKCLLWIGDLLDSEQLVNSGDDLYLRISGIPSKSDSNKKEGSHIPVALFISLPLIICSLLTCVLWHICRKRPTTVSKETDQDLLLLRLDSSKANSDSINTSYDTMGGKKTTFDLPQFSFSSVCTATNNFSVENKLGEGGFGPVYKGDLLDGQSVAVKRLSERSGQGLEELRNEMIVIAKLQHRNLVKLLGCCIENDEKILIYEYMPNKSLDSFLFNPSKQYLLDWNIRVRIIEGIAQGLLYLHQHSRLRIIHRDLKASNILLDGEMNPKISDFGMARISGGDMMQENTRRIVGTYGYMSPEYAIEGRFSVKSDVFAFGVLLLEILSGRKNTGFRNSDCPSLLGYAWELWKSDRGLELIDLKLDMPLSVSFKPLRFIHVGLLCVQDNPADRPNIADVLSMFSNESMQLVSPKRPAFTGSNSSGSGTEITQHCSVNDLTASSVKGR